MKGLRSVLLGAAAGLFAMGSAEAGEKIAIGEPNWAYAKVITNVLKVIGEENYGVEISMVPGKHPVFFKGMDQGKGEVDIHPDVWLPNNDGLVNEYVKTKGTVALTHVTFPAMDGFCTTKAAMEKYGLKSVYDLTKPEIVTLTDRNGDGKGEIWLGGPGWKSTKIHEIRARDYGFRDLYEMQSSEEDAFLAQLDADIKASKVIVFACYQPHHIFGMYDLVVLEEPAHDPAKWKIADLENDANWLADSTAGTSFPPTTSQIAYSKRLETAAPEFVKFLNRIDFGAQLINEWSKAVAVDNKDPAAYAKEWVKANPDKVKAWIGG